MYAKDIANEDNVGTGDNNNYGQEQVNPPPGYTQDARGVWVGPGGATWDPASGMFNLPPDRGASNAPDALAATNTALGFGGSGSTNTGNPYGGSSDAGSMGQLIQPFTGSFTPPQPVNLGGPAGIPYIPPTPTFTPPGYTPPPAFSYSDFQAPNAQDVLKDPGYQFRLGQGEQALQQSAAGRGILNTGGTLKDILDYGQNYASQEYGNAYNRSADEYKTNRANAVSNYMQNYQTQYVDPYQIQFQGAQAAFAPQMTGYSTQAQAGQRQTENDYSNAFSQYQQMYKQYQDAQSLLYAYRSPFLQG